MYGNYSTGAGDAGLGVAVLGCWGLVLLIGLAMFVLNIWMLIDAIGRQEYEFPGSTGNSKNLWIILLIVGLVIGFGWIVALVYYFKVFKVVKRGTVAPQWAQQPGMPQPPYAPPAPPAYQPPAAPQYAPPTPPAAPMYTPPAPPMPPEPMPEPPAPPVEPPAPAPEPPAPPAPPAE
jgi:hypothetical protein